MCRRRKRSSFSKTKKNFHDKFFAVLTKAFKDSLDVFRDQCCFLVELLEIRANFGWEACDSCATDFLKATHRGRTSTSTPCDPKVMVTRGVSDQTGVQGSACDGAETLDKRT